MYFCREFVEELQVSLLQYVLEKRTEVKMRIFSTNNCCYTYHGDLWLIWGIAMKEYLWNNCLYVEFEKEKETR